MKKGFSVNVWSRWQYPTNKWWKFVQRLNKETTQQHQIKKQKQKKKQEENKQGTKSSTDDEASSTTRYETAHIPWPHRATERNTEHLIVVGSWLLDFFFSFHVCIQKCLFHRRGRPRSFKSIRKQFFLVIPSVRIQTLPEHLTGTWTIERKRIFIFPCTRIQTPLPVAHEDLDHQIVSKQTHLPLSGCAISWVFHAWEVRGQSISLSSSAFFSTGQRGWNCWRAGWAPAPLAGRRLAAPESERWRCWGAGGARWTESWWRRMERRWRLERWVSRGLSGVQA